MAFLKWELVHPRANYEMLGYIPTFLRSEDERSAKEQLDENYAHGGGWRKFDGFDTVTAEGLIYPGDPLVPALATTRLRDELIVVYQYAWVAIFQPDGTSEVARMN
jgi:hypothetical protein